MKKHINLQAYNNYEFFNNKNEELKYRELKLQECDKHINFIKKIKNKEKINFLELGSGNSKLLYNLYFNNLLNIGYGIEISKSRYNFANNWKNDIQANNIINFNNDFINFDYTILQNLDIVFCVDLAFQFCEPIKKNSERVLLKKIYNQLNTGGKLIMELDGCKKIIETCEKNNKIWEEFTEPDPWKYSLWDCKYQNSFLNWKKVFISRNGDFDESSIIIKIYSNEEIRNLLYESGFEKVFFYKNWNLEDSVNDFSEFIVVAQK